MVRTSPSSRMTTPLPSLRVPYADAVNASSGTVERAATVDFNAWETSMACS